MHTTTTRLAENTGTNQADDSQQKQTLSRLNCSTLHKPLQVGTYTYLYF